MFDQVKDLFDGKSPYDDEPLEDAKIHVFAKDLIELVGSFFTISDEGEFLDVARVATMPRDAAKKGYRSLVKEELKRERLQALADRNMREKELLEAAIKASEAATSAMTTETIELLNEADRLVALEIQDIKETCGTLIDELKLLLQRAHQDIDRLSTKLSASEERVRELSTFVTVLSQRIQAAESRAAAAMAAAQSGGGRKKFLGIF